LAVFLAFGDVLSSSAARCFLLEKQPKTMVAKRG
jgi:hypothetical protein